MNRKAKVVAVAILTSLVGGAAYATYYVKANEKQLIRAHIKTLLWAGDAAGLHLVSEYRKDKSQRRIRLTFDKPEFPVAAGAVEPRTSVGHRAPGYFNYSVTHKEGFSKGLKTYNDSFNGSFKMGEDQVDAQELDANSPVQIYFNPSGSMPVTLNSTLGEGDKTKNLDEAEKGGMSVYNVPDSYSEMNLKVTIRWSKKGKAVCQFKARPFKDLEKTEEKFEVVNPDPGTLPTKEEQWYTSGDGNPIIAITIGTQTWSRSQLAYTGSTKEKVDKNTLETAESYKAKGKTAWWGNF
jgi:hypothetical protein